MVSLALLNQSEYLPNQILHGTVGLVVFLSLFFLSFRRPSLWARYIKVAAYFHLALAVGVLVFKLSSLQAVDAYILERVPALKPFYPFEPAAHMVQELATMGAYAYLAVFYLRRNLVNVIERPRVHFVLGTAFHVYTACWLVALLVGLAHPFPMTGLDTDLDGWSVLYRGAILLPGVLYCSIFTFVFWEASLEKSEARSRARLSLLALGSLSWTLICAEQFGWAMIHAWAPASLRDALATPHVVSESALYSLMGASWLAALLVSYRRSATERSMEDHREYQRLMRQLKRELHGLYRLIPNWRLTLDRMHRAGQALGLSPEERAGTQKCVELVAVVRLRDAFSHSRLTTLFWLRRTLLESLPESAAERMDLLSDPVAASVGPALLLTSDPPPTDLSSHGTPVELAAVAAADTGLLQRDGNYHVSPHVTRAYSTL